LGIKGLGKLRVVKLLGADADQGEFLAVPTEMIGDAQTTTKNVSCSNYY
jgi:hypothetical protein